MNLKFTHDLIGICSRPIIFNTYQCYLKEAFNNLTIDMSFAEKQGFHFGAKLVRGAYLDFERKRAAEIGYPDPINPSYESTCRMYDRVVGECLNAISAHKKVCIMVASHNEESVNFTTERMSQLGIKPNHHQVSVSSIPSNIHIVPILASIRKNPTV